MERRPGSAGSGQLLRAEGLCKQFGGLTAVHGVSFTLNEGHALGIIGPNGAGKTTLFHLISGLQPADQGAVYLAGQQITGLPPHQVCRRGLARTFQIVQPFGHLSTLENVMVGAYLHATSQREAAARGWHVLERVGLAPVAQAPAARLTLMEKKRLELARALATRPRVLLLDEIMAGLRPGEVDEAIALVRELRDEGVTLLMIEHNFRVIAALCERVLVLHHGEMLADGPPQTIARDPRVLQAYWGEEVAHA